MRFNRLRAHNMGVFSDFELDLNAVPGPLVALIGANGSGKTTALELLFGSIFRECPTRGSLADLATARDSFVEVQVSNGKDYTFRQSIDATSRKGETLITNGTGEPVISSTKVRDADAWVAQHMPAKDTILSSLFCAQQSSGFLGMQPGERKSVLLKLIGVEKLERLAEEARERARTQKATVATLAARLADERARGGDAVALEAALADVRREAEGAEAGAETARRELDAALAEAATVGAVWQAHEAAASAYRAAEQARQGAAAGLANLETRAANNRAVLEDRARIESAVDELPRLQGEEQAARRDAAQADSDARVAAQQGEESLRAVATHQARALQERARVERLRWALSRADEVEAAARCLPGLRRDVEAAEAEIASAERVLEELRGRRLAGADERIAGLRGGLSRVVGAERAAPGARAATALQIATDTLDVDDSAVRAAAEVPEAITLAAARVARGRERAQKARGALQETEALAALAERLDADRAALAEAEQAVEAAAEAAAEAEQARAAAVRQAATYLGARDGYLERAAALAAQAAELRPLAARSGPLEGAAARLAELEPQIAQARAEIGRLDDELAAGPPGPPPPTVDVAAAERSASAAEGAARQAAQAVAVAESRLSGARESADRAAALEAELSAAELDLADWTRLAADLGRDGLQGAIIDSAIPELNEHCNSLLHEAFGPRFTVDLRTQRLDAKGKREIESLDVIVIDTERGREAPAETLSGGERVIVQEALSLGLTAIACRSAGLTDVDLVRDETGAALDPEKAAQYVRMLRRAADLIGARHILFVSHNQDVHELADARIELGAA